MRKPLAFALLALFATTANASIIYNVNRTIGAGTVTGFVETDGTVGVLMTANITAWMLTLSAPNLLGSSPNVIDSSAQINTEIMGDALTATATQLLFDFDQPGTNFFLMQGNLPNANYWCVETEFCVGETGSIESIGRNATPGPVAQSVARTGTVAIASTVPEPATLTLLILSLGGLGFATRHQLCLP